MTVQPSVLLTERFTKASACYLSQPFIGINGRSVWASPYEMNPKGLDPVLLHKTNATSWCAYQSSRDEFSKAGATQ
jgi:hypothetical protein